jgi:HTH-type transcriptional regulator/antitoxin HigA
MVSAPKALNRVELSHTLYSERMTRVDTRLLPQAVLYPLPMTPNIQRTANAWSSVSGDIFVPHTEQEYAHIATLPDHLIDEVGEDENHPLASLMEVLSVLSERYEGEHVPELTVS